MPKTSGFVFVRVKVGVSPAILTIAESIVCTTDDNGNPVVSSGTGNITLPSSNKNTQYVFVFELTQFGVPSPAYYWPTSPNAAAGIKIWTGNEPGFGTIPQEFDDCQVNGNFLVLRDKNDNGAAYNYCLQVTNGSTTLTLDPRIANSPT